MVHKCHNSHLATQSSFVGLDRIDKRPTVLFKLEIYWREKGHVMIFPVVVTRDFGGLAIVKTYRTLVTLRSTGPELVRKSLSKVFASRANVPAFCSPNYISTR